MMSVIALLIAYLLGAVPMGYVVVRWSTGQDITTVGSGRTGGTNAFRAAGLKIGLLTTLLDALKGYLAVWLASLLAPGEVWTAAGAAALAVAGHNWSLWVYLKFRRLSAGAGTAPNMGAAAFFWFPLLPLIVAAGGGLLYGVGYASLASFVVGLLIPVVLAIRVLLAAPGANWSQVVYGVATLLMVSLALWPNFRRLFSGTERLVGWRARRAAARSAPPG